MKIWLSVTFLFFICLNASAQNTYTPTPENFANRQWFQDAKFGLFVHWGPFSIPGSGEWVMNQRNITVNNYSRLEDFFNPIGFNAKEWVSLTKGAGMKYITLITRHHDGFSMWDTRYSDFNIMHTPYKKDIVKQIADECHQQGVKLFLYYSLLDWRRDDYSYWTGRTGQGTGRTVHGDWNAYIDFMKNQLTELLTNYGEIGGIWFDGYWDQLSSDTAKKATPMVDWHMEEIYTLIHKLQPQCLVGNNHHIEPLQGEDFQMFEKDLPGGNTTGFGGAAASALPLETCETINDSWGFNITDTTYKTHKQLVDYLVKAAGFGANFLLNIGPMPDGNIQPEFVKSLQGMGKWLDVYGESIYHTRGGYLKPQSWGSITQGSNGNMYVHVLASNSELTLDQFPFRKLGKVYLLKNGEAVTSKLAGKTLSLSNLPPVTEDEPDVVIVIEPK